MNQKANSPMSFSSTVTPLLPYCQFLADGRLFVSLRPVREKSGRLNMIITITIAVILALIFGKITIKEVKEYVNKLRRKKREGSEEGC